MRRHRLGADVPAGSWSPAFKVRSGRAAQARTVGRGGTRATSWFPTLKGQPRMEGLRRYFHADLATILDASWEVTGWTAATTSITCEWRGQPFTFAPDFHVEEESSTWHVRLLRAGTQPSDVRAERHAAVSRAYAAIGERLVVVTADELARDSRLPDARVLFYNRLRDIPPALPEALADCFGDGCPTTLGEIHQELGGGQEAWCQLLCLGALGYVHIALGHGLGPSTPVLDLRTTGYRG